MALDHFHERRAAAAQLPSSLPGGSEAAAWLHLARTVARRAERRVTRLAAEISEGDQIL